LRIRQQIHQRVDALQLIVPNIAHRLLPHRTLISKE
jgi:hypothetical protein